MNTYYELGAGVASLISSAISNDQSASDVTVRRMKDMVRRMDDKTPYTPMQQSIVFSELFKMSTESLMERDTQSTVVRQIRQIYGEYHVVLGDLYGTLCDIMMKRQQFAQALELAGQALVVRANCCGILHDKTADSHFTLGVLYRYLGLFDKARQELYISRGIRAKLHGESSLLAAQCDLHIGHTEIAAANSTAVGSANTKLLSTGGTLNGRDKNITRNCLISAYVAFYRCFHTRYLELGATDPLTVEAQQLVLTFSNLGGERLVCATELKLRVSELQWTCTNTTNWLYSVALFVGRLSADDALTLSQVRQLVASAIKFSVARLNATGPGSGPSLSSSMNSPLGSSLKLPGSRDSSPSRDRPGSSPTTPNRFSKSLNDLSLDSPRADLSTEDRGDLAGVLGGEIDPEQEQIGVITSMLMMIPKPFQTTGVSPGKRSGPASPSKVSQLDRGVPKLRIPGQGALTSSSGSALNSPDAADRPAAPLPTWTLRQSVYRSAADKSPLSPSADMDDAPMDIDHAGDKPEDQAEEEKAESPSKFQSKLKAVDDEAAESPVPSSPPRTMPENWKPVKSAYSSMAWTSCHHIESVDFAIGLAETIYARDTEGILLVLRRALGDTVEEARRNEEAAKKQARKSIRRSALTGAVPGKRKSLEAAAATKTAADSTGGTAGGGGGGADPKAALNALFGKRAPPPAATGAASAGDEAGDPKAKLNALFSKQPGGGGLKLGGGPPAGGGGAAKPGSGPVWGTDIPIPPPIPISWPPEPYTAEASGTPGPGGDASAAAGAAGAAATTSTIVNADGTVVTISLPAAAAPAKAKLKQIYLVSLPAIEGTLWAETGEELISPDELFDDLEAEFTLEKPKVKKPNQTAFGGGPAAAAGLKATGPGGGGKSAAEETVLDAQRAQNLNIMLMKVGKKTYFELAQSIKNFEADALGAALLSTLGMFVPTGEETSKVTAFVLKKFAQQLHLLEEQRRKEQGGTTEEAPAATAAPAEGARPASRRKSAGVKLPAVAVEQVDHAALTKLKLGKAEQFIFVISQVPKLETRLSAMVSVLSAKETSQNILASAEVILNAVNEVRGSGRLKFLLKAFLDLNNALSKAAKSSEKLTGIKLESLAKITQTKSNSGETVEQYVVNKVMQHFPDALKVAADVPSIEGAKAVLFPRMVADLRKLEEGITMMRALIELDAAEAAAIAAKSAKDETSADASAEGGAPSAESEAAKKPVELKSQITTYLERSEAVFAKASKQLHEAQRDFSELCVYFGEEPPGDPDKLFGQIITFVKGIQAAAVVAETKFKKKARPQIKLPNMVH